jgi:hypothetical protein
MASQQSIPQSIGQSKFAVVPFPTPQAITQTELVLFRSLRSRLEQLREQVTAAEEDFKARLEAGAIVQPGDHVARLDERSRRNVAWRKVAEDLANTVFGDGNGVKFCDEVVNATNPTITTSLVIR